MGYVQQHTAIVQYVSAQKIGPSQQASSRFPDSDHKQEDQYSSPARRMCALVSINSSRCIDQQTVVQDQVSIQINSNQQAVGVLGIRLASLNAAAVQYNPQQQII